MFALYRDPTITNNQQEKKMEVREGADVAQSDSQISGFGATSEDFPGGPVAETVPVSALIPRQGAKIPHASWPKKPKNKTEAIL